MVFCIDLYGKPSIFVRFTVMNDTTILNIPFQKPYIRHLGGVEFGLCTALHHFGVKTYGGVRFNIETGETEFYDLKSPFEKLPSSFADMAVKVYHHTKNCIPYVSLNASPKFLQGHNVYGSDFIYELVCEMLGTFKDCYRRNWHNHHNHPKRYHHR